LPENFSMFLVSLAKITRNQETYRFYHTQETNNHRSFAPGQPTERWLHRTTAVKIRVNFFMKKKTNKFTIACGSFFRRI